MYKDEIFCLPLYFTLNNRFVARDTLNFHTIENKILTNMKLLSGLERLFLMSVKEKSKASKLHARFYIQESGEFVSHPFHEQ